MALSEAKICNLALVKIGVRAMLNSLTENKPEARICAEVYPECRDQVLASFDWPFATLRSTLAQVPNTTLRDDTGWAYQYAMPADCIRARFIWGGSRAPAAKDRVPFTIEGDAKGLRYLLTDQAEAKLCYTARIENPAAYPPLFVDALAWRIGVELALSLPVKPQLAASLESKAEKALNNAIGTALSELQEDVEPDSDFITGRR